MFVAAPSDTVVSTANAEMNRPLARKGSDAFDDLMRAAGLSLAQTRGEIDQAGDATIKLFTFDVVPPADVTARSLRTER